MKSDLFKNKVFLAFVIIIIASIPTITMLIIFLPQEKTSGPLFVGGTINEDTTWEGHIFVQDNVIVSQGVTLTILPGTFVEFQHASGYKNITRLGLFTDGGTIKAIGNPDQQIWFTSDAEQPINGDWGGILCTDSKDSVFKYIIVEFPLIGIELINCSVSISHSIIRWVHTEGIKTTQSTGLIEQNLIYQNGYHEIVLEDFNQNVTIQYNIFNGGNYGIYSESSNCTIVGNYFVNYSYTAIIASAFSNVSVLENKFEQITGDNIANDSTCTPITSGNDFFGNGSIPIPTLDFIDHQPRPLGYIPGDPEDQYMYVYPLEDETRRVIDRLDNETSFDWTLAYVNGSLWKFNHKGGAIGDRQNFIQINLTSGNVTEYENNDLINPNGLAYDGEYFWTCDIVLYELFKFKINSSGILEVNDSYTLPSEVGSAFGVATDNTYIYLSGSDGSKLFKLDKSGILLETITLSGGQIYGVLTWTGSYFWAASEIDITKWHINGTLMGRIYPAAEGTIGIAWDGTYLWTSQKTCENWLDGKIFQIEILDDEFAL
ncbi:MAG: right-handed parallel beta-helix repeat-containing protein [Promethearchaeota archaeon]